MSQKKMTIAGLTGRTTLMVAPGITLAFTDGVSVPYEDAWDSADVHHHRGLLYQEAARAQFGAGSYEVADYP
jgi:hypothetical protein